VIVDNKFQMNNLTAISWWENKRFIRWDDGDDICFVLDQHA